MFFHCFYAEQDALGSVNWVAFMIVDISELEKGDGNLDITLAHLRFS